MNSRFGGLFWSLRNRMMALQFLAGFVPIVLMLSIAALGFHVLTGPIAAFMVHRELVIRTNRLHSRALDLAWNLENLQESAREEMIRAFIEEMGQRYPGILAYVDAGPVTIVYPTTSLFADGRPVLADPHALLHRNEALFLAAQTQREAVPIRVLLMVPIDDAYFSSLLPGIDMVTIPLPRDGTVATTAEKSRMQQRARYSVEEPQEAHQPFDYELHWITNLPVNDWKTGQRSRPARFLPAVKGVDRL